jgi:hypothetical protein
MARPLELTLASVLALMGGVYVLRSSRAEQARHQAELAAAVARRASLSEALLAARADLETERRWQGDERANLTRALQQRRRRRRIPPSPYQPKPFVPVATTTTPVATAPVATRSSPLSQLKDFPCALRDFKVAKVTKTCELLCKEATCARALKHCERLVECDAVVVDGQEIKPGHNRDLSKATVRLLRDDAARAAADGSRSILESSKWWGSALKQQTKPRTYIVVSYGGCGSKMLAGWLAQLPRKYAKHVYHFHDKRPPDVLRELPPPPRPSTRERDFRARRFPGGGRFRTETKPVADLDDYRVLYIFKDPVEAMVSRFGFGHCKHLDGDCGVEQSFPKLDVYAQQGVDRMGLLAFFEAYTSPQKYPIVALNYHKLWQNREAVMSALGLPASLASSFPERTETVRNDLTAAGEGNKAHSEATRRGLDRMYGRILERIRALPAVSVA